MNKDEIVRYLKAGRTKSVCVDRCLCNTYPGYVRDITIRHPDNRVSMKKS